jgi:hypothetical protein
MEIKISKSSKVCAGCQQTFVHEQEMSSLVRIQNQVFCREDYCASCWKPDFAQGAFSVWSPKFYDPKVAEQEPPEVFSPLRKVFYDAAESEDRKETAVAYLAAQLLRRQKVFRLLKESDGSENEVRVALYADRIAERLIEARDPSLSYAELEAGRVALMERLNQLENPEPPQEAQTDAQAEQS